MKFVIKKTPTKIRKNLNKFFLKILKKCKYICNQNKFSGKKYVNISK